MSAKTATKRSLKDLSSQELEGKRVLVRVDLNVPLDASLKISDDTRVRAIKPTVQYLIQRRARILLVSHLVSHDCIPLLQPGRATPSALRSHCRSFNSNASKVAAILLFGMPRHIPALAQPSPCMFQGRPKGPEEKSSLKHVVESLCKVLGVQVWTHQLGLHATYSCTVIPVHVCDAMHPALWFLSQHVELQVQLAPDCVGAEVQQMVDDLQCGQVRHKTCQASSIHTNPSTAQQSGILTAPGICRCFSSRM